jgi:hypothetical protein
MIRTSKHKCLLAMIIGIFLMFLSLGSSMAAVGDIDIAAPSNAPQGSTISCGVTVDVGSAILGSYDVTFTFDPNVLQISHILGGTTSEFSGIPTFGDITTANITGQIHIVAYQSSITSPTNLVSIFTIRFNVVGAVGSSSTLSMLNTSILDPDSGGISHQVQDTNILVNIGGTISGSVLQADNQPISGLDVYAVDQVTGAWMGGANTGQDGSYSFVLPSGTYNVRACASCSSLEYVDEWYNGVFDQGNATAVSVTVSNDTPNIDFALLTGGVISGNVMDSLEQPIAGVYIHAYSSKCWADPVTGSSTDINGNYSFRVPAGNYYVWANASSPTPRNYVNEWWTDTDGAVDCNQAGAVGVAISQTTPNIDFLLDEGATVSGTVYQSDGQTPVTGVQINVTVYSGDPCGAIQSVIGTTTDSTNGTYSITGIPAGTYYLQTNNLNQSNYLNEWWASPSSTHDCNGAQTLTITAGQTVTGRNFQLDLGGTISGTVYQSDGSTPITGVQIHVNAYNGDPCGLNQHIAGVQINSTNGTFSIYGVPAGTYYLLAFDLDSGQSSYVSEWWASPNSSYNCSGAQIVTVTAGQTVTGKNFQLDVGGTISGTVYQSDGTTPITDTQINVTAFSGDPCGAIQSVTGTATDSANGTYSITGVPAGTYYLLTWNNGTPYMDEWWASPSSTYDCNGAQLVTVTAGQTSGSKNFQLDQSATITGTVTQDTNGQPVSGVQICGGPFPGGQGGACTNTQTDGSYSLSGFLPGYTRVTASGAGFVTEYYDNSYDYNWATAVWAPAGQTTSNIDFSMGNYGSVSGTVSTGTPSSPLANICVDIYQHPCAASPFASAQTDINGYYMIGNLPPQPYYVKTRSACTNPLHYDDVWWNSAGNKVYCDEAGPVGVNSAQNTGSIDFTLNSSESTYPGPSFRSALVFYSVGSDVTSFFAIIDGPAPSDIVSVTATGPSGTFTMSLAQQPFLQLGNFYNGAAASHVTDGTYTFEVTDSLGRTATVDRTFTYDGTIPQVDAASMRVDGLGNNAYVGTTTPTLSWSGVTWPGTPGYYQVIIYDYDSRAIWRNEITENTSFTVPAGVLRSDSAYYWWVRACDIPATGERGQNRNKSENRFFYTGAEAAIPDLSQNLPYAYTAPETPGATWFGVHNVGVAPWDIESFRVIGPEGTVYPSGGQTWFLYSNMWYNRWSSGLWPLPDGNYTFELTKRDSTMVNVQKSHTYSHVPGITETGRSPADNAYVYTTTPTFSWASPAGGVDYFYNFRIYDYNRQLTLYSSPNTMETTFTVPETFVQTLPPGSYQWQVRVYNGPELDSTNAAISPFRTFTLPSLSETQYTLPVGTGDVRSYRLFTVPYYMGSGTALLNAMEAVLGPYDPTHWRVFALINGLNVEITATDFASLTVIPGMGFWIITLYDNTVPFEGALCPQDTSYERSLPAGWHAISLPWSEGTVNLGDITVSDGTTTYQLTDSNNALTQTCLWDYTGDGPETYNYFEKRNDPNYPLVNRTGYLLEVLAPNVTLTIPPPGAIGVGAGKIASAEERSGEFKNEPPPAFPCKLGQNTRASSEGTLLPLPPGGRVKLAECSGCLSNENILKLQNITFDSETPCQCAATESIDIGVNVKIKSWANVTFKAPKVNILAGFHAEPGAVVEIKRE